jgi:hypothetical protein
MHSSYDRWMEMLRRWLMLPASDCRRQMIHFDRVSGVLKQGHNDLFGGAYQGSGIKFGCGHDLNWAHSEK